MKTKYRTHNCGELGITDVTEKPDTGKVTLCGWVQRIRKMGGITFIDLRDRYGITQLFTEVDIHSGIDITTLGRESVIRVTGKVLKRQSVNRNLPTGEIEVVIEQDKVEILNKAITPPFTIEDETDGGDELRMKYRYLDLRRNPVRKNLELRHRLAIETRNYLDKQNFLEVETPVLIKSTPEGARDFVVPSRVHDGQFYALPQSPQTFKQLLMVSGFDRYYQIVKCFRDEDLRADRQPEFTQIDCEMSFVEQEDILQMFEGLVKHLFKAVKGIDIPALPHMTYADAMKYYGNDKPDTRFEMKFVELNDVVKGKAFKVFDDAELVVGICAKGAAEYTRKQLDELTDFVKRPQIGATGLIYARHNADGTIKSSVDKFYNEEDLKKWGAAFNSQPGDLILVLAGAADKTRKALSELRLEMGNRLGYRALKYGIEIVKRSEKFSCNQHVYSMRIGLANRTNMSAEGIISVIKDSFKEDGKSLNSIELIHLSNNKYKTIYGDLSDVERKHIEDIVIKKPDGVERNGEHFFIFVKGEPTIYSILSKIRKQIGEKYNLSHKKDYSVLWVVDFPLLEWNDGDPNLLASLAGRWHAKHHPFTSPKPEDIELLNSNPGEVRANAYDMVINGVEIGGGSIRIHNKDLQAKMFEILGFTKEDAQNQFGFLMNAFEFGAPPHGGLAFGFDRLCSLFGGSDSIRDFIAFPKNNAGRDVMIDSPSAISDEQLNELHILVKETKK